MKLENRMTGLEWFNVHVKLEGKLDKNVKLKNTCWCWDANDVKMSIEIWKFFSELMNETYVTVFCFI